MLTHLEEDLQINITDYFDLILGTSTGGIIALGLGIGMSPREIVTFYVKKGQNIFPRGIRFSLRQFWRNKFNASPLETALKECFNDKLLGKAENALLSLHIISAMTMCICLKLLIMRDSSAITKFQCGKLLLQRVLRRHIFLPSEVLIICVLLMGESGQIIPQW